VRYIQWGLSDDFNVAVLTIEQRDEEQKRRAEETMTKSQIVAHLAAKVGIPKKDVSAVL